MNAYSRTASPQQRSRLARWWRRQRFPIGLGALLLIIYVAVVVLYGYEFMSVG
jgi:hypothetical protein